MNKISILTPTYNRRKFKNLYIENLKKQTYDHNLLSLYILDDGDEPFIENIEEFKKILSPIKVYYEYNKNRLSIGAKRNKLVKLSKDKILCFMDDDDIYMDDYIKISYNTLIKNKVGLTGSNQMMFVYPNKDYYVTKIDCGDRYDLIHEATMMFTKKYYRSMGGFKDKNSNEGVDFILNNKNNITNLKIDDLMCCVCHQNNTIDKERFKDSIPVGIYIGDRRHILEDIFTTPQ